jgi:small-conductance mechanosensitive channel
MDSFLAYVYMLGIAVLVGKVVLLSFVVAPVLAGTLDPEHFGTVVRRLFPAYYLVGITTAVIGLIALGAMGVIRGVSQAIVISGGVWGLVLASEAYCRSWMTPQSNVMRDRLKQQEVQGSVDPRLKASWNRLHQRSVFLNTAVLIAGLILLGLTHPQSP